MGGPFTGDCFAGCTKASSAVSLHLIRCDRLFIPIHQKVPYKHWTVLMVDLQQQALVFFDSLPGSNNPLGPLAVRRVKQWLADEARVSRGGVCQPLADT